MRQHSGRILLLLAAVVVGVSVWLGAQVQRGSATAAATRVQAAQRMLAAALGQEAALRGFQLTRANVFLDRSAAQSHAFAQAAADLADTAERDPDVRRTLGAVLDAQQRWRAAADDAIDRTRTVRAAPPAAATASAAQRRQIDELRADIDALQHELDDVRADDQRVALAITVLLALLSLLAMGAAGLLWLRRRVRAEAVELEHERRFRDRQQELARALLSAGCEDEAHRLLTRHLEQDGCCTASVLRPDHDRARPPAAPPPDAAPLAGRPADADVAAADADPDADPGPHACVALRLVREHVESDAEPPLLRCEVCADAGAVRLCTPLVVRGEAIGTVLTTWPAPPSDRDRRRVRESVTFAAPVLANLRAIARARSQAATDELTGLPNRRALDATLRRMVAQALRSEAPLTAIAVDLDHFKDVNDRFGHPIGDAVLVAVAAALRTSVRASDVVGRWGGEEFLVLAPDTRPAGGLALAEVLRRAVASVTVDGLDQAISASFGVAACPDHATGPEALLRQADRALYAAKDRGRNRVEPAHQASPTAAAL